MATRLEVSYQRRFTDSQVQDILARGTLTLNVLEFLGPTYHNLPGYGMAEYEALVDSLKQDVQKFQELVDSIRPLLISIDANCRPLDEKNKGILRTLQGLLNTDADRRLLDQITGPTPRRVSVAAAPEPALSV